MVNQPENKGYYSYMVYLTAFCNRETIRMVRIPKDEMDDSPDELDAKLQLIFHYGQNDFQEMPMPSVSVGDVISFGCELFMVKPTGFQRMSKQEFETIETPTSKKAYFGCCLRTEYV